MDEFPVSNVPIVDVMALGLKRVTEGWCQGRWKEVQDDGRTAFCLLGSVRYLPDGTPREYAQVEDWIAQALLELHPELRKGVGNPTALFNDQASTTQSDAIAVMQRAYDLALFGEGNHE